MNMSDLYKVLIAQNPVQDYLTKNMLLQYASGNPSASMPPPVYDVTARQRQNLYNKMDEGGGGKGGTGPSMGTYGAMTQAERQNISDVARTMGALSMAPSPISMGLGVFGKMLGTTLDIDDLVGYLGLRSRGYEGLSDLDVQNLNDTYGYGSSQLDAARTASAIGRSLGGWSAEPQINTERQSLLGSLLGKQPDPTFSALEAARMDLENSLAEQGYGAYGQTTTPAGITSDWGEPGAYGGWGGPDNDPGGIGHSAGDTGQAGYARGGVGIFNQPARPLVGEAGPEMGIFIKPEMFRPGIQGNEEQVKLALFMAAMGLGGRNANR